MNDASATEIGAWVTAAGLAGAAEPELLRGFCERSAAAGVPLARALVLVDTLHPVHEGRAFWRRDPTDEQLVVEYGRTSEDGEAAEGWRRSAFYHLLETGGSALRRSLARGDPADFPRIEESRARGETDYLALIHRFAADAVITDTAAPEQVIPLLNDYAEAVIAAVHEAGGDVLKLIGDGTLAIFRATRPRRAGARSRRRR